MFFLILSLVTVAVGHATPSLGNDAVKARSHLTADQRVSVLKEMLRTGRPNPPHAASPVDPSRRVHSHASRVYWVGSVETGQDPKLITPGGIGLAMVLKVADGEDGSWDDDGARAFVKEASVSLSALPDDLRGLIFNYLLLREARAHYLATGIPSALAVYQRALFESIRADEVRPNGREYTLFGRAEASNLPELAGLIFETNDQTRVLHLLLTMIDVALAPGLNADIGRHAADHEIEGIYSARVTSLARLLRHIRDTPAMVLASTQSHLADSHLRRLDAKLRPLSADFIALDQEWRRLELAFEESPVEFRTRATLLGGAIHQAISSSTYHGFPTLLCDDWLTDHGSLPPARPTGPPSLNNI